MTNAIYLKKVEIAKMLRVTTRTIENYVNKGLLPAPVRIGGRPLWPEDIVLKLLNGAPEGAISVTA